MHSLFKWRRSIAEQELERNELHCDVEFFEEEALTRDSRHEEAETVGKRCPAARMRKEIEGDNSRKVVTHSPSQEVLLTHQREIHGGW